MSCDVGTESVSAIACLASVSHSVLAHFCRFLSRPTNAGEFPTKMCLTPSSSKRPQLVFRDACALGLEYERETAELGWSNWSRIYIA